MDVPGTPREQLLVLIGAALVFLVARIVVGEIGASRIIEQTLYGLVVACLAASVLVITKNR